MALLVRLSELAKKRAVTPEVQAEAATVWKEQTDAAARLKSWRASSMCRWRMSRTSREEAVADAGEDEWGEIRQVVFGCAGGRAGCAGGESGGGSGVVGRRLSRRFAQAEMGMLKAERERVRKLGL
jgi:hypothetical protein